MLTQDQIARVERLRDAANDRSKFLRAEHDRSHEAASAEWDADALSALLQERETLRAALRRLWVDPPCHPGGRQCRDRYGDREAWCMTCTGELDALLTPREDR